MILRDLLQLVLFIGLLAALSRCWSVCPSGFFPAAAPSCILSWGRWSGACTRCPAFIPTKTRRGAGTPSAHRIFPCGFLLTFGVLLFQDKLPLNPQGFPAFRGIWP